MNIINSKKVNDNNNNNNNNKEEKENNEKLERKMNYKRSYKSTRTRELNLDNNGSKKVLLTKMNDMKNNLNVNNKISSNNSTSTSNNDINKRSHSISLNQNEEENNKIDSYRNTHILFQWKRNGFTLKEIAGHAQMLFWEMELPASADLPLTAAIT